MYGLYFFAIVLFLMSLTHTHPISSVFLGRRSGDIEVLDKIKWHNHMGTGTMHIYSVCCEAAKFPVHSYSTLRGIPIEGSNL
jgi:hypothetical protein